MTCSPALTEASFVIRRLGGLATAARFVRTFETNDIDLEPVTKHDLGRVAELLDQYADLRLDFTDAVLIALAERLGVTEIATLDHRDFSVVRPRHIDAFTLLP